MTPDRNYRVSLLRSDEVTYLDREAKNRVERPCCPHLGIFHSQGDTSAGGNWRSCKLCDCIEEHPPSVMSRLWKAQDKELDRLERRNTSLMWGLLGMVCGVGLSVLYWVVHGG